jgi:hypothetical protein
MLALKVFFHILDLLKQEKTCSTRLMTRSHLHKIIIPKVPDRGGRTGGLNLILE